MFSEKQLTNKYIFLKFYQTDIQNSFLRKNPYQQKKIFILSFVFNGYYKIKSNFYTDNSQYNSRNKL